MRPEGRLSIVVYSGEFDRVHYALAMAAAALAVGREVTLFFTMGATQALTVPGSGGWQAMRGGDGRSGSEIDAAYRAAGIGDIETLLSSCAELGARVMVCEMGLRVAGLEPDDLRGDLPLTPGGLATFMMDAGDGTVLFV